VLFHDGKFQWKRLRNLIALAKEGTGGLDLSDTVSDGARVLLLDARLRTQLLMALTEDNKLHLRVSVAFTPATSPTCIQHSNVRYRCVAQFFCRRPVEHVSLDKCSVVLLSRSVRHVCACVCLSICRLTPCATSVARCLLLGAKAWNGANLAC